MAIHWHPQLLENSKRCEKDDTTISCTVACQLVVLLAQTKSEKAMRASMSSDIFDDQKEKGPTDRFHRRGPAS